MTTTKNEIVKGWYVAESALKTSRQEPRREIREGETLTLPDAVTPKVCEAGYHASERLLDAFRYRTDGVITLVEVSGDVDVGDDKVAGRSRKTLRIIPREISERECRLFAADVAERLLLAERAAGREPAVQSRKAIEVARAYAVGKATDEELQAVRAAAAAAAELTWSAEEAAWAAEAAVEAAAEEAAAAAAAVAQVKAAVREELSRELEERLLKAVGYEGL